MGDSASQVDPDCDPADDMYQAYPRRLRAAWRNGNHRPSMSSQTRNGGTGTPHFLFPPHPPDDGSGPRPSTSGQSNPFQGPESLLSASGSSSSQVAHAMAQSSLVDDGASSTLGLQPGPMPAAFETVTPQETGLAIGNLLFACDETEASQSGPSGATPSLSGRSRCPQRDQGRRRPLSSSRKSPSVPKRQRMMEDNSQQFTQVRRPAQRELMSATVSSGADLEARRRAEQRIVSGLDTPRGDGGSSFRDRAPELRGSAEPPTGRQSSSELRQASPAVPHQSSRVALESDLDRFSSAVDFLDQLSPFLGGPERERAAVPERPTPAHRHSTVRSIRRPNLIPFHRRADQSLTDFFVDDDGNLSVNNIERQARQLREYGTTSQREAVARNEREQSALRMGLDSISVDTLLSMSPGPPSRAEGSDGRHQRPRSNPGQGQPWNEELGSRDASGTVNGSDIAQQQRPLASLLDPDVVPPRSVTPPPLLTGLPMSLDRSPGSSSGSNGSFSDAIRRGVPRLDPYHRWPTVHHLDISDTEDIVVVHDSESESDSELSDITPPVELPLRRDRNGPGERRSLPPDLNRTRSSRPDFLPSLNDFLMPHLDQYESDEDLARRLQHHLQEEADRELAMSLSRSISQLQNDTDAILTAMNTEVHPTPAPRRPDPPQVPPAPEPLTPPPAAGTRATPYEVRPRSRFERSRERVRHRAEVQTNNQDRNIHSPILLRLSPGSRQLVLRFHNARRIAAERAGMDVAFREGLDRLQGYELLLELTAEMDEIKPRGATNAEIGLIPEMKYQAWRETTRGVDAAPEKDECIICMVELEDSHDLRVLHCTHYFHKLCIDKWLMSCATCPVCRDDIRGIKT